jgi:hypothetical protein
MKRKTVMTKAAYFHACWSWLWRKAHPPLPGRRQQRDVEGNRMDQTKAAVAGATVTAKSVDRGTVRRSGLTRMVSTRFQRCNPEHTSFALEAQGFGAIVLNNIGAASRRSRCSRRGTDTRRYS